MNTRSVRYQQQVKVGGGKAEALPIDEAIERVKQMAAMTAPRTYKNGRQRKKVDQTLDVVVNLGIDAKKADQALRGAISLPKGTGQTQRVIAFCNPEHADDARTAGAIEVGADELIEKINGGWTDFDIAIAHPQLMGKVGKLGRVLGPAGKMPSPKAGTVTPNVADAVREYAAGKMEYRNDAGGNIHLRVGKASFATADLKANIEALLAHLQKIKPATAKGTYIKSAYLSGQQTPSVKLSVA